MQLNDAPNKKVNLTPSGARYLRVEAVEKLQKQGVFS